MSILGMFACSGSCFRVGVFFVEPYVVVLNDLSLALSSSSLEQRKNQLVRVWDT